MKLIPLNVKNKCKKKVEQRFAVVDDIDYERVSQYNWFAVKFNHTVYAARQTGHGKGNQKIQFMHRFILNLMDTKIETHHKDHNGLHNWRDNLIACTHQQNLWDRTPVGKSKYLGVHVTKHGRIRAMIRNKEGIKISLGSFKNEEDAARAYNAAAIKFRGEYAGLNKNV